MRDADCISEVLCGAYRAAVRDVFGRLGMPNSHASRLALVGRGDLINQGGAIDITRVFKEMTAFTQLLQVICLTENYTSHCQDVYII